MPNSISPAHDAKHILECNPHLRQTTKLFELQIAIYSTQVKITAPEQMKAYCSNLQAKLVEHTGGHKAKIETCKLEQLLTLYINHQIQTLQQAASQNTALNKNANPVIDNPTSTHEALSIIEEAMPRRNHKHAIEAVYLYLLMHDNELDKPQTEHVINHITTYVARNTSLNTLHAQQLQPYKVGNYQRAYYTRKVTRIITLLAITLPLAYAAGSMLSSNLRNFI